MTTAGAGSVTAIAIFLFAWIGKIPNFHLPAAIPTVLLTATTIPMIFPSIITESPVFLSTMSVLYGATTTCLSLAWLELLAHQKIEHIAGAFALSMLIKSFISLVFENATEWYFVAITTILLAGSSALLTHARHKSWIDKESLTENSPKHSAYRLGFLGIADAIAVSIVLEAVVSVMSGFFLGLSTSSESGVLSAISGGLASIAFCLVALAIARYVDIEHLYRYLFPILLALVVLLPLSFGNAATEIMKGMLVFTYDFISFSVLYFILRQIRIGHFNTYILAAGVTALVRLSQLIFGTVGYTLGNVSSNGTGLYWIVIIVSVYGLSMLLLYLSRRRSQPSNNKIIVTSSEDRFITIANELATKHHLTAREKEITLHLARGRSASFIANESFCSPATVRTHTKNIYAKLNVHSKQELIDLFS